ncbi:MAG: alkane 1-monooxygenase [Rhodobacter sp.]|nr:alkane 1-monooxygenase [Rhodobacter sp.]
MTRAALAFSITSLLPVPLIVAAALVGGAGVWAALLYVTLFAFMMDEVIARAVPADRGGCEFPAHDALSVVLALAHFAVLGLTVHALAGGTGLGGAERLGLFLAAGLFLGQVGNSNAHELIHRGRRGLNALGRWVYISVLFGHHSSAHPLVHHRFVATDKDPNSARAGESYYRFARRAWIGSFKAGLTAERDRLRSIGRTGPLTNPYAVYFAGAALAVAAAAAIGGMAGILAHLALSAFAQSQLLISDYVQHYGLRRGRLADGRLEPVGPQHSWNAPHWFTGHMMLNAPRHSDHHGHPARPYPALTLPSEDRAPILPRSLPAMALLALWPRKWKQVMDPRVAAWTAAKDAQAA